VDKAMEYKQFEGDDGTAPGSLEGGAIDLGRIGEIPMELSVQIGRTQMTVSETLALRVGSIVILDRFAGEPVDLLVNGTPIAQGEVVVVEEKFGLRMEHILEDLGPDPDSASERRASDGVREQPDQPDAVDGDGGVEGQTGHVLLAHEEAGGDELEALEQKLAA
jgi:flagellar motor switch protein FliN